MPITREEYEEEVKDERAMLERLRAKIKTGEARSRFDKEEVEALDYLLDLGDAALDLNAPQ